MASKIQFRRDTTANWTTRNPVLSAGELGYDLTLKQFKIGDGVTAWNTLTFFTTGSGGGTATVQSDSDWITRRIALNRVDSDWVIRTIKRLDVDSDWVTKQLYTKAQSDSDLLRKTQVTNTFYVNTGGESLIQAIAKVGTSTAKQIILPPGSIGATANVTTINNASTLSINAPANSSGSSATEILGKVTLTGASSTRVRFSNVSFDSEFELNGTLGRHTFKGVTFQKFMRITGSTTNFLTFEDCYFDGGFVVPNTFAGVIYLVRCTFNGIAPTLSQASPLQVIMSDCSGLPSYPTNATLFANNTLSTGFTRWTGNELRVGGKTINGNLDSDWVIGQIVGGVTVSGADSDWVIRTIKRLDIDSDWVLRQVPTAVEPQTLYAEMNTTQPVGPYNASNGAFVQLFTKISGSINFSDANSSKFKLTAGKKYSIEIGFATTATTNSGCEYGLYNNTTSSWVGKRGLAAGPGSLQTVSSVSYIVDATNSDHEYGIRITGVYGTTSVTYTGDSPIYIKIVEIAASNVTSGGSTITSSLDSEWVLANAGIQTRATKSVTTSSLANGATGNASITGYKGYHLLKITTSAAAWVRVYTDTASRTADASRLEGVDPTASAGVVAEVITTGAQSVLIAPAVFGFSNEGSPTTAIPIAVTNKSGSSAAITVDLSLIRAE